MFEKKGGQLCQTLWGQIPLLKKVDLKLQESDDGSDKFFYSFLLLISHIRTQLSWCTSSNSGHEYPPDYCKINCKEQLKWLPLKNKDIILCALYIMVGIVQTNTVKWWNRWTMKFPPLLYCKSMFVLFLCIENCDEPRRWQSDKYECRRNTFSTLLGGLFYSYIWLKCTVCNLFAMSL